MGTTTQPQFVRSMMNALHANASRPCAWARLTVLPALALAGLWTPAAHADVAQLRTLMQRNNCVACHEIDKRKYGPHFQEVALRYASDPQAVATLAAKIKAGGSGVWGADPMPPQPQVSDEHARTMAELIMALPR
jgi:cytochrome c